MLHCALRRILLFSFLLVMIPAGGRASAAGLLAPTDQTLPPLRISDHLVDVTIENGIARTFVTQRFVNDTNRRLEATYIFPLPEDADLTDFTLSFNGKQVKGEVLPADQARQIYESIVRQSRDPGLIEFIGRRLLRMRVFPIEPKSTTTITMAYQQVCTPMSDMMSYCYPLRTPSADGKAFGTLRFAVDLKASAPLKAIWSPTHTVDIARDGETKAKVAYERTVGSLDEDFVLLFDTEDGDLGLSVVAHKSTDSDDGHFTLLLSPRHLWETAVDEPQDVVFVLDTSGSMAGEKIVQARRALEYCVQRLDAHDRFNIVRFSTGYDELYPALEPVTTESRDNAATWIEQFRARGGTNISDTLAHVFSMLEARSLDDTSENRPFVVVFLTDGNGNQPAAATLKRLAEMNVSEDMMRVFTFAVGDDVDTAIVDTLATTYHGKPTYVRPGENLELMLGDFFSVLSHQVLTNLKLTLPAIHATERYPVTLGDLYHGQQIVLAGKFATPLAGPVTLTARQQGKPVTYTWDDVAFTHEPSATYVSSIWAGRKIAHLVDAIRLNGRQPELMDELMTLSMTYGIQTPYTSWFVNPEEQQVVLGQPVLRSRLSTGMPPSSPGRRRQSGGGGGSIFGDPDMATDKSGAPELDLDSSLYAVSGETATEISDWLSSMRGGVTMEAARSMDMRARVEMVRGRKHFRIQDVLVDEQFDGEQELITVRFGSAAYFELLTLRPELRDVCRRSREVAVRVHETLSLLVVMDDGIDEFSDTLREQIAG
ncbi:MAG: VIT domain-containing protein [Planctomycetota bacterium]